MTVSEFTGLEQQVPVIDAQRSMQAAQAALYPHLTKEGAEKMWQTWADAAWRVEVEQRVPQGRAMFTLNGQPVSFDGLRAGLAGAIGRGLAA